MSLKSQIKKLAAFQDKQWSIFKGLEFKYKLILTLLFSALIGIVSISIVSYFFITSILTNTIKDQLQFLRNRKSLQIQEYFLEAKKNASELASNRFLQDMFILSQDAATASGAKNNEDVTYSSSSFTNFNKNTDRIDRLANSNKFSSMHFVTPKGQVTYSNHNININSNKEKSLLGKNLINGELKNTAYATCFKQGLSNLTFIDFTYHSYFKENTALICTPVHTELARAEEGVNAGDLIGVLIVEIDFSGINKIVKDDWLVFKENTYLFGNDYLLRSNIKDLNIKNHPLLKVGASTSGTDYLINSSSVESDASSTDNSSNNSITLTKGEGLIINKEVVDNLLANSKETNIYKTNGESFFISLQKINILNEVNWYIVSELKSSEVFRIIHRLSYIALLASGLILIIIGLLGVYLSKIVVRPIITASELLEKRGEELEQLSVMLADMGMRLSNSAAEQASSTTESVAAMNQMEAMITQTNDFASNSQKVTKEVKDKAERGNQIMSQLSDSMDLIHQNNNQLQNISQIMNDITKKTNIINEIVFNTKILSFNASIEAARAGQHGRGFAVVAEEVSRLASTSGSAAQEIQTLLDNSKKQVNEIISNTSSVVGNGHEVATNALAIFKEIVGSINEINEHIRGIVQAGTEELDGIKKTSVALHQLDRSSQDNSKVSANTSLYASHLRQLNIKIREAMFILENIVFGKNAKNKKKAA